jgi:hypothetical protein
MKKLPQDNAPSVMKPWVRSIIDILTGFETDINKLKVFMSNATGGSGISNGIANANISAAKLANTPIGSLVPVMTSGFGSVSITTANTAASVAITYPTGLFTVAPTVVITPRLAIDTTITGLTTTSWTETGFTATANRSVAGTINFSWIAIGN